MFTRIIISQKHGRSKQNEQTGTNRQIKKTTRNAIRNGRLRGREMKDEMKYYQVVGFGDTGPFFRFTVTAKNFSEALREISKDYYMTDMTDINFYKLEIREIE